MGELYANVLKSTKLNLGTIDQPDYVELNEPIGFQKDRFRIGIPKLWQDGPGGMHGAPPSGPPTGPPLGPTGGTKSGPIGG